MATSLRSWWGRLLGPAILAFSAVPCPPLVLFGILFAGISITGLSTWAVYRRSRYEDDLVEQMVGDLITTALIECIEVLGMHAPAAGGRLRANVMLVQEEDGQEHLVIAYNTIGYSAEEEQLRWCRGEGAAGRAWETGQTQTAPIDGKPLPRFLANPKATNSWAMSPEQIAATKDVKMVVSAPIIDPTDRGRVAGVVSIDDTLVPGDHLKQITQAAEHLATEVERQLRRGRLALSEF